MKQRLIQKLVELRPTLPGIASHTDLDAFAAELASTQNHLARFQRWVEISTNSAWPTQLIDPGWDACHMILTLRTQGDLEEATWLSFLSVHIGRGAGGWQAVHDVYLGHEGPLTWRRVTEEPIILSDWYRRNKLHLNGLRFSNHRKFESWKQFERVIRSYVDGIRATAGGSQASFFEARGLSPTQNFERLMREATFIYRFGRLANYDFLCLLGDLHLYRLEADRLYLVGATGPLKGARRLFGPRITAAAELDELAVQLAGELEVRVATMEDALCNWQKLPHH